MKIAIGADHRGMAFKKKIIAYLQEKGIDVEDVGAYSDESSDYPDFGIKTAEEVAAGKVDFGVLVCWTGNGMAMAANKVRGVRAGIALSPEMAELTRAHNDANVLVVSGKYTPVDLLDEIVDKFLETGFEGGRHKRRVDKIMKREDEN
jgi:ribose 5-phosphate isomerase B